MSDDQANNESQAHEPVSQDPVAETPGAGAPDPWAAWRWPAQPPQPAEAPQPAAPAWPIDPAPDAPPTAEVPPAAPAAAGGWGWPWAPVDEAATQPLPPSPGAQYPGAQYPGAQYPGGQDPGPQYTAPPTAGPQQYTTQVPPAAAPPTGPPPPYSGGYRWAEPPARPPAPARPPVDRAAAWIVGILVLMMVSGVGGAAFASITRHRSSSAPSSNAFAPTSPTFPFAPANPGGSTNTTTPDGSAANGSQNSSGSTTGFNYTGEVDITSTLASGEGMTAGTGMLLDKSGNILTNNHVIAGAQDIRVQFGGTGTAYKATVTGYDVTHDVAVLHLSSGPSNATPIKFGDSSSVNVGDRVIAVGNALGKTGPPSVVEGSVTDLDQTVTAADDSGGTETLYGMIQTDAQIQPGDSGGPLFDSSGKVIGMITAGEESYRRSGPTTGFAIPINSAKSIADQIVAGQTTSTIHIGERGLLGVQLQPDSSAVNGGRFRNRFGNGSSTPTGNGAVVAGVQSGSPASSAGMQEGDVIISVNGKAITKSTDVGLAMNSNHPGDKVSITWRDSSGSQHSATVRLIAGPPA